MKKLLLFGGTTEGRLLAEQACALGWEVTLCVATEYGREVLPQELPFCHILVGRLGIEEMKLLMAEGFHQVVDATHPYAVEVSSNVRSAAQSTGLPHWRLLRQPPVLFFQLRPICFSLILFCKFDTFSSFLLFTT